MSNFLEKFSPTVADVSRGQFGAAVPGVVGGVAGYAAWRHLFPRQRYGQTHKMPAVGVLTGMATGEVAQELYRGGNVTRQAVISALGIIGAILLPKYAPKAIARALPATAFAQGALRQVAYPITGFLAGKAIGSTMWKR